MNIHKAIETLAPGAQFEIRGESYEGIVWRDGNTIPCPTEAEVIAEMERQQLSYVDNQYQRDRQMAYPSIADQLDLLYHGGFVAWRAAVEDVKNRYPKP